MKFLFKDHIDVLTIQPMIEYDFGAFSSTLFIRKTKYYRIIFHKNKIANGF